MKWDDQKRAQAADLFETGFGYDMAARILNLNPGLMRNWLYTYRALGREALFVRSHKTYSFETKYAAVLDKLERGLTTLEIMQKYGMRSKTQISAWVKDYKTGGIEALKPKPKGRKPKAVLKADASVEEKLQARIQELELELEIQKRINALADEKNLK